MNNSQRSSEGNLSYLILNSGFENGKLNPNFRIQFENQDCYAIINGKFFPIKNPKDKINLSINSEVFSKKNFNDYIDLTRMGVEWLEQENEIPKTLAISDKCSYGKVEDLVKKHLISYAKKFVKENSYPIKKIDNFDIDINLKNKT